MELTEETEERGEKRTRTDTDTECTQSRQKKGQRKSICLSKSDEEAIMDFMKQHEELFDKIHVKFKDKQRKEGLWGTVAASRNLPVRSLLRSGLRLNIPDIASSHRPSRVKLQPRTPRDRPG